MKVNAPKFSIGDSVFNIADGEIGVITSFSYDPSRGYLYQTTSKEVDLVAKEVIHGFKTVQEDEIEASDVESTHNPEDHVSTPLEVDDPETEPEEDK